MQRRYLLTGTPIPNRRLDLWHQLAVAQPRQWDNKRHKFGMQYCGGRREAHEDGGHFVYDGETNDHELRARLAGTMLRYTRYDVQGQLPDLKRERIVIQPQPDDAEAKKILDEYHFAANDIIGYLKSIGKLEMGKTTIVFQGQEIDISKKENRPQAVQLRSISSLIGLLSDLKAREAVPHVLDLLRDHTHVVVFTWRRDAAKHVARTLRAGFMQQQDSAMRTLASVVTDVFGPVDGTMKQSERRELAQEFARAKRGVYVATFGSAGISINELSAASCVLFVDLHWNPSTLTQAESRVHRDGSPHKAVESYYLVVRHTIDELLIETLIHKANAAVTVSPNDEIGMHLVGDLSATNAAADQTAGLDEICALLAQRQDLT